MSQEISTKNNIPIEGMFEDYHKPYPESGYDPGPPEWVPTEDIYDGILNHHIEFHGVDTYDMNTFSHKD